MSDALIAVFTEEAPGPDFSDRTATVDYLVDFDRLFAAQSRPRHEAAGREFWGGVYDRTLDLAAQMTNPFLLDAGEPWRPARPDHRADAGAARHRGSDVPLRPRRGAGEGDPRPAGHLEQTGHENPPRHVWDIVIPEIVGHTARR